MSEEKKNWMTQASYDKLQAELDERSGPLRSEITRKIDAARREGDLKENGGYHAARDEQAHNETLGQAVLGHRSGDKVEYAAPTGKTISVEILSVEVYQG